MFQEQDDDAEVRYYDSDFDPEPGEAGPWDFGTLPPRMMKADIDFMVRMASECGGPVLEVCVGTGRLALPLARAGFDFTGVDLSAGMLARLRRKLDDEPAEVRERVTLIDADATELELEPRFRFAFIAANSLSAIASFDGQLRVLQRMADALVPGGVLALDMLNPLLNTGLKTEVSPRLIFTHRNRETGNVYSRFSMLGQYDAGQRQRIYGWYDEVRPDGAVTRSYFSTHWRVVFRYELESMVRLTGLEIDRVDGGLNGEPFAAFSPRYVLVARKPA